MMSTAGIMINGVADDPRASLHVITADADEPEGASPQAAQPQVV